MHLVAVNSPIHENFADSLRSRDQLVLRIGGMSIVTEDTGEKAFLRVRRKFSLTGPQSPSVNRQEGRERSVSLMANGAEIEDQPRQSKANITFSINNGDPLPGLIRFAEWAKDAIAGQKEDIGRISDVVSKTEMDMKSFTNFMVETRRELAAVPGGRPWERMKRSVTFLEEEVGSLRTELENRPDAGGSNEDDGVKLSVEELDVLTSSITKISQKVNEVESLKMELQFMKTRLKRFEDASRTLKQAVEPQARESSPAPPAVPNSSTPRLRRVVSEGNAGGNYSRTPKSAGLPRKRKSDEYESNSASEMAAPAASGGQKKRIPLDPAPTGYWKIQHKPSRLSNVQYLDDVPDPEDDPVDAGKFIDGHYSEGDRRAIDDPIREYDSAPESRSARRKTLPIRDQNNRRDSSSPEEISPPPDTRAARPTKVSRLQALQKSPGRTHRRAQSETLRNEDGIRLTKKGEPDRRSGNYKYLRQYYERLRVQKEQEEKDTGQGQEQGDGEGQELVGETGDRERTDVMPSVEGGVPAAPMIQEVEEREEALKQAELEARDRLVRETLEREL